MTTFYLIRHGETDWNKARKLQGHTDIPLNATGEQQAKKLTDVLHNVNFDLAFSSDMIRAKRTAEIILLEKKLHIETTKKLRERTFGELEGQSSEIMTAYFALVKALTKEERKKHRMGKNVESDEEVTTRLITFLRETAITHPEKTILVTTHSGLLRMLLLHTGEYSYEALDKFIMENGAYITFRCDGIDFFIDEVVGMTKRDSAPKKS